MGAVIAASTVVMISLCGPAVAVDDKSPPLIIVLPNPEQLSDARVTVRARILDPSGIDRAVLWIRGERDDAFRAIDMRPDIGDEFVAPIALSAARGSKVAYYIEAHDRAGNGPRFSGNPRSPFLVRLMPPSDSAVDAATGWIVWAVSGCVLFVMLLGVCFHIQASREQRRAEVVSALATLTVPAIARTDRPQPKLPPLDSAEQATIEMFWFRLLAPLRDMSHADRNLTLSQLCMRAHHHPIRGRRIFDRATVARQLEWVRHADPRELHERWSVVSDSTPDLEELISAAPQFRLSDPLPTGGQRGMTLVEVLVVVVLIAVALGVSFVYFNGLAAPVQTAGELVEGMLQHTRSRAMVTTTPHRLRPIDSTTLVVESGASCSSGPWTLEPDLQLDLPDGVVVSDTTWDVCFVTRGASTTNQIITLNHPEQGSQQIEVLLGGAVEWLP